MTGPKHLWSGNWQEEARQPAAETPAQPAAPAQTAQIPVRRPERPLWRTLAPVALVLLLGGVAVAELVPGGAARHRHAGATTPTINVAPNAPGPNSQSPAPVIPGPSTTPASGNTISGRTITWLGMQISTVQNVGTVIQTVQLGTPADAAGLDPGDIIQSVNHRSITAAAQIRDAVRGLKPGDTVEIAVDRGSTLFATVAAFSGQPTTSP